MTDVERAAYYAKLRIAKRKVIDETIKKEIIKSFRKVISMVYSSGVTPSYFQFSKYMNIDYSVNREMEELMASLYHILENYAYINLRYAQEKNQEETDLDVVAYINRPYGGRDISGRLSEVAERAKNEFEAYVAAGMITNTSINKVIREYGSFLSNPKASPILKDARADKEANLASLWLITGGLSYGSGKYKGAYSQTKRTVEGMLGYLYNDVDNHLMRQKGAIGYIVNRGSSYPCQECDENTGFHPITEQTLPVHAHCMCWAVPVYQ